MSRALYWLSPQKSFAETQFRDEKYFFFPGYNVKQQRLHIFPTVTYSVLLRGAVLLKWELSVTEKQASPAIHVGLIFLFQLLSHLNWHFFTGGKVPVRKKRGKGLRCGSKKRFSLFNYMSDLTSWFLIFDFYGPVVQDTSWHSSFSKNPQFLRN